MRQPVLCLIVASLALASPIVAAEGGGGGGKGGGAQGGGATLDGNTYTVETLGVDVAKPQRFTISFAGGQMDVEGVGRMPYTTIAATGEGSGPGFRGELTQGAVTVRVFGQSTKRSATINGTISRMSDGTEKAVSFRSVQDPAGGGGGNAGARRG